MASDPYRWIARIYDPVLEPTLAGARRLGLKFYPPARGMVVLDIGCGTGTQLELYRQAGCVVIGVDPSPAMVERARGRLGDEVVQLADASRLPVADRSADLVLLSMTLHELAEDTRAKVMAEARRAVRDEGRLLVFDFHPGPLTFPRGWLQRPVVLFAEFLAGVAHFHHHLQFLSAGGVPPLASAHHLEIEKSRILAGGNFGMFLLKPAKWAPRNGRAGL